MGMFDYVYDDECEDQVKVWDNTMARLTICDTVPEVNGEKNYTVCP